MWFLAYNSVGVQRNECYCYNKRIYILFYLFMWTRTLSPYSDKKEKIEKELIINAASFQQCDSGIHELVENSLIDAFWITF